MLNQRGHYLGAPMLLTKLIFCDMYADEILLSMGMHMSRY
jgi:hypothetical protein